MLHLVRNDGAAARTALGQALAENLGYAPAHATLGDAALGSRNVTEAIAELSQAVELAPHDVWYRHRLGIALLAARRADSALIVLEDVSRREPLYADAYFDLGRAKEMKGDAKGAGMAYAMYLARAAARDAERIEWVRGRVAGLLR